LSSGTFKKNNGSSMIPRKIQIALLKKQYALRKKLQKWRDLQLESFMFKRTQSINRPFVYSHLPGKRLPKL
jgi:hypothetical protein